MAGAALILVEYRAQALGRREYVVEEGLASGESCEIRGTEAGEGFARCRRGGVAAPGGAGRADNRERRGHAP